MMTQTFGATRDDWNNFELLGLTEDLLPVVSNPNSTISPNSKMKGTGKTPSRYNRNRLVAGIPNWTEHKTTSDEIKLWSAEPDYGICIQTREVRALDVDVEDITRRDEIWKFINEFSDKTANLPARTRSNTGKFLLAFRIKGELPKRILPVECGIIEFLATGQQFVVCGTHTSGVKYELKMFERSDFPTITLEQFDTLWNALAKQFGTGKPMQSGTLRQHGDHIDMEDIRAQYLIDNHEITEGRDGQFHLPCPFKDEHTSDSGITEFSYFPAGTNGYTEGRFKCLHAHCAERNQEEFANALGCGLDLEFKNLGPLTDVIEDENGYIQTVEVKPLPVLERNQLGKALSNSNNLKIALLRPDLIGMELRHDNFRNEIVWRVPGKKKWKAFVDTNYFELQTTLEGKLTFRPVQIDLLRRAVHWAANKNSFDSAIEWLESLKWDGKPRIDSFCSKYFDTEDNEYTRAVSAYIWTALAGRILEPGVKADMVPVLISGQGKQKSWGISALAPDASMFTEIDLIGRDADLARCMQGKVVIEIPELRGLHSRDQESIKAFITRTKEEWVPKYQEFPNRYYRRFLFMATHNKVEFLTDTTGNRRWLPIQVNQIHKDAIERDRDQLWAEGAERFKASGIGWENAENLAAKMHDAHRVTDLLAERITDWLDKPDALQDMDRTLKITPRMRLFKLEELMDHLSTLGRTAKTITEHRVAEILRELGFDRERLTRGDKKGCYVWRWKAVDDLA